MEKRSFAFLPYSTHIQTHTHIHSLYHHPDTRAPVCDRVYAHKTCRRQTTVEDRTDGSSINIYIPIIIIIIIIKYICETDEKVM